LALRGEHAEWNCEKAGTGIHQNHHCCCWLGRARRLSGALADRSRAGSGRYPMRASFQPAFGGAKATRG